MFKKHPVLFPILLCVFATTGFLFFANTTLAQNDLNAAVNQQIAAGAQGAEFGEAVDPRIAIANMIRLMLTFMGVFFMGLIIMGGYWWLTDRGEEDRMVKAKKTITRAVTGLILTLMAYSITLFISNTILTSVRGDEEFRIQTRERSRCIVGGDDCFFQGGL